MKRLLMVFVIIGLLLGCAGQQIKNPPFCEEGAESIITDVANKMKLDPAVFWKTFINVNAAALRMGPPGSVDVAYGVYDNLSNALNQTPKPTYYDLVHLTLQNGQYLSKYVNTPAGTAVFTVGKIGLGLLNYDIPISDCDYLQFLWGLAEYYDMLQREFPRNQEAGLMQRFLPGSPAPCFRYAALNCASNSSFRFYVFRS